MLHICTSSMVVQVKLYKLEYRAKVNLLFNFYDYGLKNFSQYSNFEFGVFISCKP